jgi:hypothetical protein
LSRLNSISFAITVAGTACIVHFLVIILLLVVVPSPLLDDGV